ncbi:aryl-sulfate sulfotransferase [Winogradskyella sp. PC D3.3]
MKHKLFISLFFIIIQYTNSITAQETLGLLYHNATEVAEGYTLFSPLKNSSAYLIDNCGNTINEWSFNGLPKSVPYILENGTILRAGSEGLEIRNWNNTLIWSYNLMGELNIQQHHDIEPLPNGHILLIVKEFIEENELIDLGKNPALISNRLSSEKIIEVKPIGTNEIEIVWEWRFADRFIQDFDATKSNYGVIENHPELIDINYEDHNMIHADFMHMNGIDYNAELDQIVMSCKSLGEIYIIDHSTTTAEAASSTGGNYNKGGDFLWRWGNPEVYRKGSPLDRKLFEQHDPKWIPEGFPNAGKITVFNNDVGATNTHSSINIIAPVPTASGYEISNDKYSPTDFFFSWEGEVINQTVFQPKMSGVTALQNGNLIFSEAIKGRLTEITLDGDIVWIYRNPSGESIINQYSTESEIIFNTLFKAEKYPLDYIGFNDLDLTPGAIIEDVNSNSVNCNENLSTTDPTFTEIRIINNPVQHETIVFSTQLQDSATIDIYNINGTSVVTNIKLINQQLHLPKIEKGLYFITIKDTKTNKTQVIKFIKS